MTVVMSDYHGHTYQLEPVEEAGRLFEEQAELIMPTGESGQAIWLGTPEEPEILRIDIDVDAGRAAVRWLPDGSHAVELEPAVPIRVLERPGWGPVTIPPDLARVAIDTARNVVVQFAAIGKRPDCVRWQQ